MTNLRLLRAMAILFVSAAVSCGCGGGTRNGGAATDPAGGENGNTDKPSGTPVRYAYAVKNTYPHDPKSYTQGLFWDGGYLWEGTGEYGNSSLMKVELGTGKAIQSLKLDRGYFGEGIAMLGGKIYQLTWLEGEALVYDAATLKRTGKFAYPGEGWGLTTDGENLYMSNGTHEIYVIDPAGFGRKKTISVTMAKRRVRNINELEWIDGKIWANIYLTDDIIIIDPQTGKVEGVVDMAGLLPESERLPDTDVLNGIAYDEAAGRIFVTGKNWPKLFEIEIKVKDE